MKIHAASGNFLPPAAADPRSWRRRLFVRRRPAMASCGQFISPQEICHVPPCHPAPPSPCPLPPVPAAAPGREIHYFTCDLNGMPGQMVLSVETVGASGITWDPSGHAGPRSRPGDVTV